MHLLDEQQSWDPFPPPTFHRDSVDHGYRRDPGDPGDPGGGDLRDRVDRVAGYKPRVGRRIQSAALAADGKHSWVDALASAGVLLGLVGVAAGLPWADALAGLAVTGLIIHVGAKVTAELLRRLMDGVDPNLLASAERAALSVVGVAHAHVRARWMGRSLLVEVEGFVAPGTTVGAGQEVGRAVEAAVTTAVPQARSVLWYPGAFPARGWVNQP